MLPRTPLPTASIFVFLWVFGCKSPTSNPNPTPNASGSASSAVSATAPIPNPHNSFQVPIGPRFAILPGEGIGPIRFGATVATIERLMEAPCEIKTADKCRYIVQAVEFELKDGVAQRIVIHRHERPAGPDAQGKPQTYGFFNGGLPPYLGFGMIPSAVIKVIGPPSSVEKVTTPNDFNTVERDIYPGMVIEYDRYTNGNVIWGGAILTKAKVGAPPGAASSLPPAVAGKPRAAPKKN